MGRCWGLLVMASLLASCGGDGEATFTSPPPTVSNPPTENTLESFLSPVHDPVLTADGGQFYLFSTGAPDHGPLKVHRSTDLTDWTLLPVPFALPAWTKEAVPNVSGAWAPDISRYEDGFRLYYSLSTFGSQVSAIGLATSPTLDPDSPDYAWTGHGAAVTSKTGDDYNAIDPNFIVDRDGQAWLSFGSFWGGLMLVELDNATGLPKAGAEIINIARRPDDPENAIEAPFIFEREGWYYLVASFDRCCRGAESTYKLVIGRSRDIRGPYLDRDGRSMIQGGGTILAAAQAGDRFQGPGHAGHYRDANQRDVLVFHAYDTTRNGAPTLRIGELVWNAGWPDLEILEGTL